MPKGPQLLVAAINTRLEELATRLEELTTERSRIDQERARIDAETSQLRRMLSQYTEVIDSADRTGPTPIERAPVSQADDVDGDRRNGHRNGLNLSQVIRGVVRDRPGLESSALIDAVLATLPPGHGKSRKNVSSTFFYLMSTNKIERRQDRYYPVK
ncbi:MAG: hypothetical protein L0271_17210 [Gemmatimonadetes bacterium]|nr:hypothetical protein [Gemmatimonadota bacterium]